jgi:sarcosine oxidase subunit beta
MSKGFDVAVIGAGIIGAACASELAEAGLQVVVLEQREAAATGSTGLSAAGVRVQFVDPVNVALSMASIETFRGFEDRFGVDCGYRPVGYLMLVGHDAWGEHLAGVDVQRGLGAHVEVLSVEEASERFPGFVADGLAGATFGPADGVVDPHVVAHTYLHQARTNGAVVRFHSEVVAIGRAPGSTGWDIQVSDPAGGIDRLQVDTVVNAAGPWAGDVAARAGLDVPVVPMRRMVFATSAVPQRPTSTFTIDLTSGLYYRSEGERLIFGRSNHAERPGFHDGIDWDWLAPTLGAAVARFPAFAEERLDRRACWHGYYEQTPDDNAILGRDPQSPDWVHACGFSGHGVQQAPAVGRAVREEIVDGAAWSIPVAQLGIGRFAASRLVHERHIV